MERITQGMLEKRIDYLNSIVGVKEPSNSVVGSYLPDYAYGKVSVIRIENTSGACSTVVYKGTKRETFHSLCCFIRGYTQHMDDN